MPIESLPSVEGRNTCQAALRQTIYETGLPTLCLAHFSRLSHPSVPLANGNLVIDVDAVFGLKSRRPKICTKTKGWSRTLGGVREGPRRLNPSVQNMRFVRFWTRCPAKPRFSEFPLMRTLSGHLGNVATHRNTMLNVKKEVLDT